MTKKQNTASLLRRIIREEINLYRSKSFLNEANPDGTISDDEEEREKELMTKIKEAIDDLNREYAYLIKMIKNEAYKIGGPYRSPGIVSRARKLIKSKEKFTDGFGL